MTIMRLFESKSESSIHCGAITDSSYSAGLSRQGGRMIKGVHTMFYSSEVEELRAFIRDKLGLPATDVGGGWLIFDVPEADMGCHPAEASDGQPSGTHYVSFYCDDIETTVDELSARGVEFVDDVSDVGYGLAIHFVMPGDVQVELYQPSYK
jgi:predicted enzyme related to lactoylglutathione lyase